MHIGVLRIYFRIYEAHSLKEKRRIIRSIKDRVKNKFNASIAEIGSQEMWNAGELGVAIIGSDHSYVNGAVEKAKNFIESFPAIIPIEHQIDML